MRELNAEKLADVLETNGLGVLAFDGGVAPYPIPIAFGYEPAADRFVVQLEAENGYKQQCLDHNPNVGFTTYEEVEPDECWRSVVLQGELTQTTYQEAESAFANLARNTQGAPNPVVWGSGSSELIPYELQIDSRTGYEFVIE